MTKLIPILILVAAIAVAVGGWKLYSDSLGESAVYPSPTPISIGPGAKTSEMQQSLELTVDDGGESDLLQLEQEVKALD